MYCISNHVYKDDVLIILYSARTRKDDALTILLIATFIRTMSFTLNR